MASKINFRSENSCNSLKLKPLSACIKAVIAGSILGLATPIKAELPVANPTNWVGSGSATSSVVGNALNINQQSDRAILNWNSFNVGASNAVNFRQPATSSIALNRIADAKPSQILGTVNANGQIYLVNKNGFVFGDKSVVNTRALTASTLDVDTQNFIEGRAIGKIAEDTRIVNPDDRAAFKGTGDFYRLDENGNKVPIKIEIQSGAQIKSTEGGRIMVLAPTILNGGNVEAPGGQVLMAAATDKVYLKEELPSNKDLRGLLVEVKTGGKVENLASGSISANRGNVTLMGFAVNQNGKVSATTSTNLNGTIRLLAREGGTFDANLKPQSESTTRSTEKDDGLGRSAQVTLASGSKTEILPEREFITEQTSSDQGKITTKIVERTAIDGQAQPQSQVEIMAHKVHLQSGSEIVAPSGKVAITATETPQDPVRNNSVKNNSRILLDSGAKIDVSGLDVKRSMESNVLEVELRNFELQDSPLQKDGILKGKTILVDAREGTPIANIQPFLDGIRRKIDERLVKGGDISLQSDGDVIISKGAVLDFSGGSTTFNDGFISTSKLVSNRQLIDISQADPLLKYDAVYGEVIKKYDKWGVTKTWNLEGPFGLKRFEKGYVQGHNAGSLAIKGHDVVLDGDLRGFAINGRRQRKLSDQAKGGRLSVNSDFGIQDNIAQSILFTGQEINLVDLERAVAEQLSKGNITDKLNVSFPVDADGLAVALMIHDRKLFESGIQDASFNTRGKITLSGDAEVGLLAGGNLNLSGGAIDVQGDIQGAGANVKLETVFTLGTGLDGDITLAEGTKISLQGQWINDFINPANVDDKTLKHLAIDGGNFSATASGSNSGNLHLKAGSVIDVSGGGWLQANRELVAGSAGQIALIASPSGDASGNLTGSNLTIDGELRAYGLFNGGRLVAAANAVAIRKEELPVDSEGLKPLQLTSEFFNKGGFSEFDISSNINGLTVEEGVKIDLKQRNRLLNEGFLTENNAPDLSKITQLTTLAEVQRAPSKLTLRSNQSAGVNVNSNLKVEAGAVISADDLSAITLESQTSLFLNGALTTHGGEVALKIVAPDPDPLFSDTQAIWLGSSAKIDVSGSSQVLVDNFGRRFGEVFDGGTVTVAADRGFFATQEGSSINVSGTQAEFDLPNGLVGSKSGKFVNVTDIQEGLAQENQTSSYTAKVIGSNAGEINITTAEGIFIDGQMSAIAGGASGTEGGKLSLSLDTNKRNDLNSIDLSEFPVDVISGPRKFILSQNKESSFWDELNAAGAQPRNKLDGNKLNGLGYLAASQVTEGGFSSLSISATAQSLPAPGSLVGTLQDEIIFQDSVALNLGNSIALNAASYGWQGNTAATGTATLAANTVSIGLETQNFVLSNISPTDGGGNLTVNANLIDVFGTSVTRGFNAVNLNANSDIRLIGNRFSRDEIKFSGGLNTFSKLNLTASQVYPTSVSSFTLQVSGDPDGTVTFNNNGRASQPVLSALGKLTVSAPNIEQKGVVKAPIGEIVLEADKSINFGGSSVTSVSAEGQLIPLGITEGGQDWFLPPLLDSAEIPLKPILDPPQKKITITADSVFRDEGALIDLSGGGDLLAYEFIPGPGGSKDVLDTNKSYAILPGIKQFAPYDFTETPKSGLTTGSSIFISGGSGLPKGEYALLPARYALLPGAFLVTPVSRPSAQVIPGSSRSRVDGADIVSGYRKRSGLETRDQLWSEFVVEPGSIAKTRTEYQLDLASQFFAKQAEGKGLALPRLTQDAGQAVFSAITQLDLPTVRADVVNGGRGGLVDITADNLNVVNTKSGINGTVELLASDIDKFKVESLSLGAIRSIDPSTGNTVLDVKSNSVSLAENAIIKAPELLLTAKEKVELKSGSRVQAEGQVAASSAVNSTLIANGDGAMLRVSAGKQAILSRSNVTGANGDLQIAEGAVIAAGNGAALLDSTRNASLNGDLELVGGSLSLGAQAINLGEVSGVLNGLSLDNSQLNKLSLKELSLNSRSAVNLYGQVAKTDGNGNPIPLELGDVTINASGLSGWDNAGKATLFNAKKLTLANNSGVFGLAGTGSGILNINAEQLILGKGNYQLSGFNQANFNLQDSLIGNDEGQLTALGNVLITTPYVSATNAAKTTVDATGFSLVLNQASQNLAATTRGIGAQLKLIADSINLDTAMAFYASVVSADALQGDVVLGSKTLIDVSGVRVNAGLSKPVSLAAGEIKLTSRNQNIVADASSQLFLKGSAADMPAGLLSVKAGNGTVQLNGIIDAQGIGKENGGRIHIDAGSLSSNSFNALNTLFSSAGFTNGIDLRLRTGDIVVDASQTLSAQKIKLTADTGKITVDGILNAQGVNGGTVKLAAEDALALNASGKILAGALGVNGNGGNVKLSSIEQNADGAGITVQNGALIDVSATGSGKEGEVHFRADRLDTDSNGREDVNISTVTPGTVTGDTNVTVEAVKIYSDNDITLADQAIYNADNQTFITGVETDNVATSRFGSGFNILPGVEVRSNTDLTITDAFDMVTWRYGTNNIPGVLTLRAGNDLLINNNLSDAIAAGTIDLSDLGLVANVNEFLQSGNSWSYQLVAGADLNSADSLKTVNGVGDLKLGDNVKVRTGTGDISLVSGRDIVYGNNNSVVYTTGRPDETNRWGFDRVIAAALFYAEYPLDGGDINLQAGRDILAKPTEQLVSEWLVRTGNWTTNNTHSGERPTAWGIAFGGSDATELPPFQHEQSVAALGGGNVDIQADRHINDLSVVIPTTGKQIGQKAVPNDPLNFDYLTNVVQVNGGGNLELRAGGDVAGGVFHVDGISGTNTGTANLFAGGSFKAGNNNDDTGFGLSPILALGDSQFNLVAGKEVALEAIIDPMVVYRNNLGDGNFISSRFFRYSADSGVKLVALAGDIKLENDVISLERETVDITQGGNVKLVRDANILPATLKAYALNGNLLLGSESDQAQRIQNLFPSANGELELFAASNIIGNTVITQSDADPNVLPSALFPANDGYNISEELLKHAPAPIHLADNKPVLISTGSGDIKGSGGGLIFNLAKFAEVKSGKDIESASIKIQHNSLANANTIIQALGDIKFLTQIDPITGTRSTISQSIVVAGPGQLTVLAGGDLDLGVSDGIRSIGNTVDPLNPTQGNSILADDGANITAIAGLGDGQLNATGFAEKFLANPDKNASEYQGYRNQFITEVEALSEQEGLSYTTAKSAFDQLSSTDKARVEARLLAYVQKVFFKELKVAGAKGASADTKQGQDQAELELLATIETLLPGTTLLAGINDYTVDPVKGVTAIPTTTPGAILDKINATAEQERKVLGGISMPFSTIQSMDGGDVNMIAPNGGVVAGLPTSVVIPGKEASDLGIVVKKQGDLNVVVRDDFDVNTGRATTLGGGSVLGVSTEQDIDAGRTPKSQISAPETLVTYDSDSLPIIEVSPPQQGGGIAANSPPGLPDGDIDLFAFRGIIDAGEAGIAGKNVTLGAVAIVGADNIDVGGVSVGVPVAPTGSIAAGLTNVSNVAASVANAVESSTNIGEDTNKSLAAAAATAILTVDFLGVDE